MHVSTDVRLLSLPTIESLGASHDRAPESHRQLVIIRVEDDDGCHGWGECSALNRPTYTAEWSDGAFEQLTTGNTNDVGPMAAAGREMAHTDLMLRRDGRSLAASLGVACPTVPAGAAVGLMPVAELSDRVDSLVATGFGRIKVKIDPGHDVGPIEAIVDRHPDLDLHVDANGAYGPDHLHVFGRLSDLGVSVIEQPFAPADLASAAALVGRLDPDRSLVFADEAVADLADARRLLAANALGGIAIKPPRVGGLRSAVELLEWCVANGVAACAGGMLESGLGRHALVAFAALPGCTITGDLSPARRWLAADPWPDVGMIETSILVPTGPGVGPEPDLETLDRFTIRQAVLRS